MRTFRLSDADLVALAAGRPSAATLAELRKAQLSRHLLQLRATGTAPSWYAGERARRGLADPLTALHTAATLAARRTGTSPPPAPAPGPRRLTTSHRGLTLAVRLEDTDPLRARLGLTPTGPLDDAAVADWQQCLDAAWRLLADRHRRTAETLAAVLSVIVPVEPDPAAGGISATAADAYGAVALSPPTDPVALAVGLVHETQHSLLNVTHFLFPLTRPTTARGYSPWRDDPRPPLGILHGTYAYQAVTRFWRTEHHGGLRPAGGSRLTAFEFARWRAAVVAAADDLLGGDALTAAGRRFAGALRAEVAAWLDEPVDPEVARLAAGANADHRARWRLRNLTVDPATVTAVIRAWHSGAAPPEIPAPAVRTAPHRELHRSERLARIHIHLHAPRVPPDKSDMRPRSGPAESAEKTDREGTGGGTPPSRTTGASRPENAACVPVGGAERDQSSPPGGGARPQPDTQRGMEGDQNSPPGREARPQPDAQRGVERDESFPPGGGVRPQPDAQRGAKPRTGPDTYESGAGDNAYLAGDLEAAYAAYLRADDLSAWSGLAIVAPHAALRERPELVRALRQALSADRADVDALAAWLSRPQRDDPSQRNNPPAES